MTREVNTEGNETSCTCSICHLGTFSVYVLNMKQTYVRNCLKLLEKTLAAIVTVNGVSYCVHIYGNYVLYTLCHIV